MQAPIPWNHEHLRMWTKQINRHGLSFGEPYSSETDVANGAAAARQGVAAIGSARGQGQLIFWAWVVGVESESAVGGWRRSLIRAEGRRSDRASSRCLGPSVLSSADCPCSRSPGPWAARMHWSAPHNGIADPPNLRYITGSAII